MKPIRQIAQEIVAREGGVVDDPDDPGGATKHGVTIRTMRRLGLDLTGDGAVDTRDVRALTRAQAVDIFVEHYYARPRIGALPEILRDTVFDMYVNSGSNAVRILQRLLSRMGYDIAIDGVIGPQTIGIAQRASDAAPGHLRDAYAIARRNYYYALADRRAAARKYARRQDGGKGGWIRRAETFMSPRFHLSHGEHAERTAGWD